MTALFSGGAFSMARSIAGIQPRQSVGLMEDLRDVLVERDLLRFELEIQRAHPSPPLRRPRSRVVGVAQPIPQQVLQPGDAFARLSVCLRRGARPDQVP